MIMLYRAILRNTIKQKGVLRTEMLLRTETSPTDPCPGSSMLCIFVLFFLSAISCSTKFTEFHFSWILVKILRGRRSVRYPIALGVIKREGEVI